MNRRKKKSTIKKKKRRMEQHIAEHERFRIEKLHRTYYLQNKNNGYWLIRNEIGGILYEYHTPHNGFSENELRHIQTDNYNVISVYDYERGMY